MLNTLSYSLPEGLGAEVRSEMEKWSSERKVARIWSRDASVWSGQDESKWLGWLDIVSDEMNNLQTYRKFAADVQANFENVLLMGMGGSSLAPEVLAMTFDKPNFRILDSTIP